MKVKQIDGKIVTCNYNPTEKGIYRWTFIKDTTFEIYIGKTQRSFERRTNEHLRQAAKGEHSGHFQVAWNNATRVIIDAIDIIEDGSKIEYTRRETEWFEQYGGIRNLVNEITSYRDFFKKRKVCE